ncbi:MAG TPA: type II toxin-antitoxin system HicA family toxin [bacterium]|nr:type II toxin-antitoxin system HicA family toxin [bacterium]HPC76701.1 type II toxin-antitoxin system HicA family toxin [bacterium]
MPRIPKNISGKEFAKLLVKYRYKILRETGSHLRLTSDFMGYSHNITIPDHSNLKVGTLNNILKDIAEYLNIPKEKLIEALFKK